MVVADFFERTIVFRLTRAFAVLLIMATFAATVIAGCYLFSTFLQPSPTRLNPAEVVSAAKEHNKAAPFSPDRLWNLDGSKSADLALPPELSQHVKGPGEWLVKNLLQAMSEDVGKESIDEMIAVVKEAQAQNVPVMEALQQYIKLKGTRIALAATAEERRKFSILMLAGSTVSGLMIMAQFSLILVLLAVERNTRIKTA